MPLRGNGGASFFEDVPLARFIRTFYLLACQVESQ